MRKNLQIAFTDLFGGPKWLPRSWFVRALIAPGPVARARAYYFRFAVRSILGPIVFWLLVIRYVFGLLIPTAYWTFATDGEFVFAPWALTAGLGLLLAAIGRRGYLARMAYRDCKILADRYATMPPADYVAVPEVWDAVLYAHPDGVPNRRYTPGPAERDPAKPYGRARYATVVKPGSTGTPSSPEKLRPGFERR